MDQVTASTHLQKRLQYTFKNSSLLRQALTHCSANKNHNERLEFLGDSILSFIISNELYRRFPEAHEGDLSQMRSVLVCRQALLELGKTFMLADHLILGQGEIRSGEAPNDSIVANAIEAIIGAIYLDSQRIRVVTELVIGWYKKRLDSIKPNNQQKDPKTRLQEYLQSIHHEKPVYVILKVKGSDHEQEFVVQCKVDGVTVEFIGEGTSRRRAEQAAAKKAAQYLGI